MRDPERIIKVLQEVALFWTAHPDLRLGQIISNASSNLKKGPDPYYMEEEELVMALRDMACPACRDREILSRCHHCGRENNPLKVNPIKLNPMEIEAGAWSAYCNLHKRVYVSNMGCPQCVTG